MVGQSHPSNSVEPGARRTFAVHRSKSMPAGHVGLRNTAIAYDVGVSLLASGERIFDLAARNGARA